MTEQEKNDLYLKYKKRIYYIANRYHFLDDDIDEIAAWGAIGFVKALNYSEDHPDIPFDALVFSRVKSEIFENYKKDRNKEVSIHAPVSGASEDEVTLENFLSADEILVHDELDILDLIEKALRHEKKADRQVAIDLFLNGLSQTEVVKKHRISSGVITKLKRRAQIKIKKYLVDNDIIEGTVDYLLVNKKNAAKAQSKPVERQPVRKEDYGKIKYIINNYPFLSNCDLAVILDLESSSISQLLEYKTAGYLKTTEDATVYEEVECYLRKWYPGQAAGQLLVIS
jgi:RNA polymerase sigma factor (sigma-70 family)